MSFYKMNNMTIISNFYFVGCRYKATVYASGDPVPTDESCKHFEFSHF